MLLAPGMADARSSLRLLDLIAIETALLLPFGASTAESLRGQPATDGSDLLANTFIAIADVVIGLAAAA